MKIKFTVLGSKGFLGSHLVKYLQNNGFDCYTPDVRNDDFLDKPLGHTIYAIGVSDFLKRPFDAVEAHTCLVHKILKNANFESFLYISTGRFYYGVSSTNENDPIAVNPQDNNQLYNISKILAESLCMASKKDNVKIVRPSNVTGNNSPNNLFLPSILRDAINNKKIVLHSSMDSERDFIYIDDFVRILPDIILNGKHKIYNVARGKNTSSREIVEELSRITGCDIQVDDDAKEYASPQISINRIKEEFDFQPSSIISKLAHMVSYYKENQNK